MNSKPVVSVPTYLVIWVSLMVLTAATTGIAYVDLGAGWNTVAALAISIGKTLLVVLYFMHLRYSSRLTWIFAAVGVLWLGLLIGGTMDDILTRSVP